MSTLKERKEVMEKLRQEVKRSKWRYSDIARRSGNSSGWVGQCLRGNYPGRGGYHLPHKLADSLGELGFSDASLLKITYK